MKTLFKKLVIAASLGLAIETQATVIDVTTQTNNTPVAIPDPGIATSIINIATHGKVLDVDVFLNSLTHTWDSDLFISLTHGSKTVTLFNGPLKGASEEENFTNTEFNDAAPFYLIQNGNTYAPYTGTFKPAELLSAFNGMDVFGDWILSVEDTAEVDSGSINSWTIKVSSVPESNSLILIALGLAGLVARRKMA